MKTFALLALFASVACAQTADMPPQGALLPAPAAAARYGTLTFAVTSFGKENVDTANVTKAGTAGRGAFMLFPYNLTGGKPTSAGADMVFNADGSLTLTGDKTGPNGELASATPDASSVHYAGFAAGGGAFFEAEMSMPQTIAAGGGWPAWWALSVESAILFPYKANQWVGQVAGYATQVENDFFEHMPTATGSSLHQSWGLYGVTCPPSYCQVHSALPVWKTAGVDYTVRHRYGARWVPATATTPGEAAYYFDGALQSAQTWQQMPAGAVPPPTSAAWKFGAMDAQHYVLILGTGTNAPMTIYSIKVWQADGSQNMVH